MERLSGLAAVLLALAVTACSGSNSPANSSSSTTGPAATDDDWLMPGKDSTNNRYTTLANITPQNVKTLTKAWSTELADNGQQESALLVSGGTMYVATPHDNVLALDATTGKVKWQFPYNPAYSLVYTVSRGVGLQGGKVFIATLDCRIIAIDASHGKQIWNQNGCPNDKYTSTANSFFSMASYVHGNQVIVGTGGGDDGNIGHVMGFSTQDGHRVWDWHNIPFPGEPGHNTWPGDSWMHGAADTWSGVTVDPQTNTLFIGAGNPGPDMVDTYRKGLNLYANSILAIDISGAKPKLRWYYKILQNDTHDVDAAMPPVLFNGRVGGNARQLVAVADKGGNFVILDRNGGTVVYRLTLDRQTGLLTTVPTVQGSFACPNHGGGVEWNGGSYDPATNFFLIPSTQECATWKLVTANPKYIPGQPYTGGPLPKRRPSTGLVTAVDVSTGKVVWTRALPYSAQGGVTITQSGVAFTSDLSGTVYALDPKTGNVLWRGSTGASIIAPISVYGSGGNEYVAVLSGSAGSQQTPNAPVATKSVLTAFRLGPIASPIANGPQGQVVVAGTSAQNATAPASVGSAPFTAMQVSAGAQLYRQQCASCHGAQLQGVSAPALTGPSFGNTHLNLSQFRSVVTTQMPLTAPGSLKPDQYAEVIAYLLKYDCVTASAEGTQPFPTANQPGFAKVILGGRSCPPK